MSARDSLRAAAHLPKRYSPNHSTLIAGVAGGASAEAAAAAFGVVMVGGVVMSADGAVSVAVS
ncbi:hypothetical protein ADILRU_0071 [Leifsonia rubra CMS 76R]|nr:hypothetical protein ADILRU_0071 [Leifsonia rubra CMS 76R]